MRSRSPRRDGFAGPDGRAGERVAGEAGRDLPRRHDGRVDAGRPAARIRDDRAGGWSTRPRRKLYNYPDKAGQAGGLLRPEVASGFAVSGDGRTYTFTIRKGFRFSDGAPVTARNFAYAIERARIQISLRRHSVRSSAGRCPCQRRRKETSWSSGLSKPDSSLLTKLAMPFFQATSLKLPLKTEVTGGYPSAGPYYFAQQRRQRAHLAAAKSVLARQPAPAHRRRGRPVEPERADRIPADGREPARRGTDPGARDPADGRTRFGINKTRFWRKPVNCMATSRSTTRTASSRATRSCGRPSTGRSTGRSTQAVRSGSTPWTHLLTPLTPGAVTAKSKQPYGAHANIAKARKLAAGHFRDGRITVAYRSSGTVDPARPRSFETL